MSTNNPNPSSSRVALKAITPGHLIVSVVVSALVAAGDATIQYTQTNIGHFSVTQLIGAALVSLFGALGTGVVSLESSPTVQQAIDGALAQHTSALTSLVQQHANVVNQLESVVHTLTGQAIQAQQQPQISQPVQQSQPAAQQVVNPWQAGVQVTPQAQQVPFPPVQRNWTAMSVPVPQQPGQSQ